jgi:hypothetical protein
MVDQSYPPQVQPIQEAAMAQGAGALPQTQPGPPQPDPMQPDFSAGTALIKGMGDPLAQANTMIQQRRSALAPLQGDVNQAAGRLKQATAANANAPQQQAGPEPQQGMGLQAAGEWVAVASVLGAIAGAMTRRSATNALAAFTGALEGVQAGNKEAFEQNKVKWEQENKRINQQLQQDNERRRAIMEDAKTDLETKLLLYQQEAVRQRDDIGVQLSARKDVMAIAQRDDTLERERLKGVESFQKMQVMLAHYGGSGQNEQSIETRVDRAIEGDPRSTQGMRAGSPDYAAYSNALSERMKREGITAKDLAQRQQQYNAQNRAETGFGTGPQGNALRSLSVADAHLQTLDEMGKALGTGNVQLINQWKNEWKRQTGEEAPTNFDAVKQIVAAEVVKAVSAAGGGVTERLEASKGINDARSPQQLSGAIQSYRSLLAGQRGGYKDQYKSSTGRDDFDTRFPAPNAGGGASGMSDAELKKQLGL